MPQIQGACKTTISNLNDFECDGKPVGFYASLFYAMTFLPLGWVTSREQEERQ